LRNLRLLARQEVREKQIGWELPMSVFRDEQKRTLVSDKYWAVSLIGFFPAH
jgi:hypothetical protein